MATVTPEEVVDSIRTGFRNSVAPTWYIWGIRFNDPELNRHCREVLRKEGYSDQEIDNPNPRIVRYIV